MTRCCEFPDVSVKAAERSESGAEWNFSARGGEEASLKREIILHANAVAEKSDCASRDSKRLSGDYSELVSFEPTHALRKRTLEARGSLGPNQSSEPTPTSVTTPAAQEIAPAAVVAHL